MSHNQGGAASLKCLYTAQLYEEPLKNTVCGHVYSSVGIQHMLRSRTYTRCPVAGCPNNHVNRSQLVKDKKMASRVRRYKSRASRQANDDEPPDDDRLDWRLDPEESYSDWTIEITCKQQDTTNAAKKQKTTKAVYHVHKSIVAFGSRKSEYFARMFRSKHFQEAESNKSCIELNHELALEAFPSMLDYLYQPSEPLTVTTETATALHYLGDYFMMSGLQRDAVEFVEDDIDVDNCHTYYEHASIFNDGRVMELVEDECILGSGDIFPSNVIVKLAKPSFWLTVFQRDCQENCERYVPDVTRENLFLKHVSRLVAEICHQHKDMMDAELFRALTDAKHLAVVCPNAALRLLEFESRFIAAGDARRTSLHGRCIESLVKNWKEVDLSKSSVLHFLETQRPALLAQLLVKMVGRAQYDTQDDN